MISILINIVIILCVTFGYSLYLYLKYKNNFTKVKTFISDVSPESKAKDMALVYESIDRAVLKSLYYYVCKDLKFDSKSPVAEYFSGHYRDLITFLLNPKIVISDTIDDEEILRPFSSVFIQRVYYLYTAETPESIKSLFFKYYSGYTVEEYYKEKRGNPSIAPFISEYTTYYLMSRYEENKIVEAKLLDKINNNAQKGDYNTSSRYQELIETYDKQCIAKLTSSIYTIYGTGVEEIDNNNYSNSSPEKPKTNKNEVKNNEFTVNFNEQRK